MSNNLLKIFFKWKNIYLSTYNIYNKDRSIKKNIPGSVFSIIFCLVLAEKPISIVSQTATKYKQFFSHCLPSSSSSTGHLTCGNSCGLSSRTYFSTGLTLLDSVYPFSEVSFLKWCYYWLRNRQMVLLLTQNSAN